MAHLESLGRVDGRVGEAEANPDGAVADDRERTSQLEVGTPEVAAPVVEVGLQRHAFLHDSENLRGVREGEKGYGASDGALEAPVEAAAADARLDEAVEVPCVLEAFWADLFLLLELLEVVEVGLEAVERAAEPLPRRRWRRRRASLARWRPSRFGDRELRP